MNVSHAWLAVQCLVYIAEQIYILLRQLDLVITKALICANCPDIGAYDRRMKRVSPINIVISLNLNVQSTFPGKIPRPGKELKQMWYLENVRIDQVIRMATNKCLLEVPGRT